MNGENPARHESGTAASRRRLLALLGVSGAAAAGSQLIGGARAAAADGDPLILGQNSDATSMTSLHADVATTSFAVTNEHAPEPGVGAFAISASSTYGVGIHGYSESGTAVAGRVSSGEAAYFHSDTGSAIHAEGAVGIDGARDGHLLTVHNMSTADGGGIAARSNGESTGSSAVFGDAQGPGIGVWGRATSGDGLQGYSESGNGIWASAVSGTGAHFESESGTALEVRHGPTDMSRTSDDPTLTVNNHGAGRAIEGISDTGIGVIGRRTSAEAGDESATGVFGEAENGTGVFGRATNGVAVQAQCANGHGVIAFAGIPENGPSDEINGVVGFGFQGYGVMGQTEQPGKAGVIGEAVRCIERGPCEDPAAGIGVLGRSEAGAGVRGESTSGPGVEAVSADGPALRVTGPAAFSTAGAGQIPQGASSATVAESNVTADSHISVTLTSDPGARSVRWVQRDPGTGFTVHLTSLPAKLRPLTDFTYLITEPTG